MRSYTTVSRNELTYMCMLNLCTTVCFFAQQNMLVQKQNLQNAITNRLQYCRMQTSARVMKQNFVGTRTITYGTPERRSQVLPQDGLTDPCPSSGCFSAEKQVELSLCNWLDGLQKTVSSSIQLAKQEPQEGSAPTASASPTLPLPVLFHVCLVDQH